MFRALPSPPTQETTPAESLPLNLLVEVWNLVLAVGLAPWTFFKFLSLGPTEVFFFRVAPSWFRPWKSDAPKKSVMNRNNYYISQPTKNVNFCGIFQRCFDIFCWFDIATSEKFPAGPSSWLDRDSSLRLTRPVLSGLIPTDAWHFENLEMLGKVWGKPHEKSKICTLKDICHQIFDVK